MPCIVTTEQLQQYTDFEQGLFVARNCKYLHTGDDDDDCDDGDNNNNNNSDIFNTCAKSILS